MADYPEIQGLPEACTESSYWVDTMSVRMPFQNVDMHVEEVPPLAGDHAELFTVQLIPSDDGSWAKAFERVRGLGYDEDREQDYRNRLRQLSSAMANNTAFYHPSAKAKIVQLARIANELTEEIDATYKLFAEEVMLETENSDGSLAGTPAALSYTEDEIEEVYPLTIDQRTSLWRQQREQARDDIRIKYDKASRLLWCAALGEAQSIAVRKNEEIWNQNQGGGGGGPAVTPGGPTPPPGQPGRGTVQQPTSPPTQPGGVFTPGQPAPGGCPPGHWYNPENGMCVPGTAPGEPADTPDGDLEGTPCDPSVVPPPGFVCQMVAPGEYQLARDEGPINGDYTGELCNPGDAPPIGYVCAEVEPGSYQLVPEGEGPPAEGTEGGEYEEPPPRRRGGGGGAAAAIALGVVVLVVSQK